jgi:exosortase/archaeosortase family protein
MGVFYAFTSLPFFRAGLFPRYLRLNAAVSAFLLRAMGEEARAQEVAIISPRYAVTIQRGCDAIEPSALFASAVIAFPAAWRRRLAGAVAGVGLLLGLNLVRIVTLYYTGVFKPEAFETMHLDVWQPAFIFLALLLWILWALWATRRPAPAPPAARDAAA